MHEQTHKIMEVAHLGGRVAMIINETAAYGLDGTEAYVSLRRAVAHQGTLDQRIRSALMLTAAAAAGSDYAVGVLTMLALRSGWRQDEAAALRAGTDTGDATVDALVSLVRAAAAGQGNVSDADWARAVAAGWTGEQLAEAFASLGLAVFTAYFLNYAGTELDLPAGR